MGAGQIKTLILYYKSTTLVDNFAKKGEKFGFVDASLVNVGEDRKRQKQ